MRVPDACQVRHQGWSHCSGRVPHVPGAHVWSGGLRWAVPGRGRWPSTGVASGKGASAAAARADGAAAGGRTCGCQTRRPPLRHSGEPAVPGARMSGGPLRDGDGDQPRGAGQTPQHLRPPLKAPARPRLLPPPHTIRPLLPAPGAASPAPTQLPLWPPSKAPPLPRQFKPVWRCTGPRGFPVQSGAAGTKPGCRGSSPGSGVHPGAHTAQPASMAGTPRVTPVQLM